MTEYPKYPVGTICTVEDVSSNTAHKLCGAEVLIVEEGEQRPNYDKLGWSYRVELREGFKDRWAIPRFYLYSRNLTPILLDVDVQKMREELETELQDLRREVS